MPAVGLLLQLLLVALTSAESWYDRVEHGVETVGSVAGAGVAAAGNVVGSGVDAVGGSDAVRSGVDAVGSGVAVAGDVVGAGVAAVGAGGIAGAKVVGAGGSLVAPTSAGLSFDKWYDQFVSMCSAKQLCSLGGGGPVCSMVMCMVVDEGKQYLVMGNQKLSTDPAASKCFSKCIEDLGNLDQNSGRQCKDQCTTPSWGDFAGNMASVAAAAAVANHACSDEFPEQLAKRSATQFEKITGIRFANLMETGEESALDSVKKAAQEGVDVVAGAEKTWGGKIGSWFETAGEGVKDGVEAAGQDVKVARDVAVATGEAAGQGVKVAGDVAVATGEAAGQDVKAAGKVAVATGVEVAGDYVAEANETLQQIMWPAGTAEANEFAEAAPSWKNVLSYIKKPDTFPAGRTLVLNISQAEDLGELVGASWVFLVHHLHPNASMNQQQFLVLDKDSLFQWHSLLEARISNDLVKMKAPPTVLGFQLSSTMAASLSLVSLTMLLALWKCLRQDDDDDLEEARRNRRRAMGRAFLAQ